MYEPVEIIFAPTGRCNLHCAHCRVSRDRGELGTAEAVAFLRGCLRSPAGRKIERVGFSGGEPFLRPDFLVAITQAAVDSGLLFDRLMTNGTWYRDPESLRSTLAELIDAGFDGTIGLSVDDWHGQEAGDLVLFLTTLFEVSGRRDMAEIVSVRGADALAPQARLGELAAGIGGRIVSEDGSPASIVDLVEMGEEARASGAALSVRIVTLPYSPAAGENAWRESAWFEDDRCEGPGQALYVHPDGEVAVCCGFANERPELRIGSIGDGLDALLLKAARSPQVLTCYGEGLSAYRARMEKSGLSFPGIAGDQCFFCDWLCAERLTGR